MANCPTITTIKQTRLNIDLCCFIRAIFTYKRIISLAYNSAKTEMLWFLPKRVDGNRLPSDVLINQGVILLQQKSFQSLSYYRENILNSICHTIMKIWYSYRSAQYCVCSISCAYQSYELFTANLQLSATSECQQKYYHFNFSLSLLLLGKLTSSVSLNEKCQQISYVVIKGHPYLRWMIFLYIINGFSGSISGTNLPWYMVNVLFRSLYDHPFYLLPLTKVLHTRLGWPLKEEGKYYG